MALQATVTMVFSLWRPPPLRSHLSLMRRPFPIGRSPQRRGVRRIYYSHCHVPSRGHSYTFWPSNPPHLLSGWPVVKHPFFFSPFLSPHPPWYFCLSSSPHLLPLASTVVSPPTFLFANSMLERGVWENLKYHITFSDMEFNPSQPNSVTCHLDNYCEQGAQPQQEEIHNWWLPKPQPAASTTERRAAGESNKDGDLFVDSAASAHVKAHSLCF